MKNSRIHYFLIPLLILSLIFIYFAKQGQNILSRTVKVEDVTKENPYQEIVDSLIRIGNCFSYYENNVSYGFVITTSDFINDEFNVGLLEGNHNKEICINDFINGSLIYSRYNILGGAEGIWTGFFFKDDLEKFKKQLKYVGTIDLDLSKIHVVGGGQLIFSSKISVKDFSNTNQPKELIRTSKPIKDLLK
jgi:hypothetical protein